MITSVAGFIFAPEDNNNQEKKVYKNIEFVRDENNRWLVNNRNQITITVSPTNLKEQNIINIDELNSAEKIYLSLNPSQNLNRILLELNSLLPLLKPKIVSSCYVDLSECNTLPIKTCKDATNLNKVILINLDNRTNINYNNNCLEIKGDEKDIITFLDNLIVSLL